MVKSLISVSVLFGLWLLLSGVYKPLIIGLGLASSITVVYVVTRMENADGDELKIGLKPIALLRYSFWLMGEVAKANLAVTKVILAPQMPIRQHFFAVDYSQRTDLGGVIFANSITLTPGTISVETEPKRFLVHALAYSPVDLEDLAEMDRRVSSMERDGS